MSGDDVKPPWVPPGHLKFQESPSAPQLVLNFWVFLQHVLKCKIMLLTIICNSNMFSLVSTCLANLLWQPFFVLGGQKHVLTCVEIVGNMSTLF